MTRLLMVVLGAAAVLSGATPAIPAELSELSMIGDRIHRTSAVREASGLCQVSSGQMDRCFRARVDGIDYTIAYRVRAWFRGAVATYIYTRDPKFVSPSGSRIGDEVTVEYDEIRPMPGFEVYLRSQFLGWRPVLGFNGRVTIVASHGVEEAPVMLHTLSGDSPLHLRVTSFSKDVEAKGQ